MGFGARLTEKRKAKGLTQDQLGEGLGTDGKDVGKAVVYGWEKDQHSPRVDQLALICEKLDASADYLLFGTVAASDLSPEVATLAAAVESLPKKQRDWVLMMLRETVNVARETITESSVTQNDSSGREVGGSASPKGRKAA